MQVHEPGSGQRKIWHYLQFSLRSFLAILLLAGAVGALFYHGLRVGMELALDEEFAWARRRTEDALRNGYSTKLKRPVANYPEAVREWNDQVVARQLIDRNCVDFAMRQAQRLPESVEKELPRMEAARQPGDQSAAYAVAEPDGSLTRYVYLFRNDVVVFSAVREASDLNWVERSMPKVTYYVAEISSQIHGYAVFIAMFVTLMCGAGLLVARALIRYAWDRTGARRNQNYEPQAAVRA